jgi:type I restriction enzyme S subunit
MSIDLFLREFERVVDTPEAVQRLRRFILDLAVRGRLTEQISSDQAASLLVTKITDAPREAVLAPRYESIVDAPVMNPPFQIPPSWVWTRLGRVSDYIQRGKSPQYSAEGPRVISQKCVRWDGLDLGPARSITAESFSRYDKVRFIRDGDLLWNSTGTGTIGRVARAVDPPADLVCDGHVTIVRLSYLEPEYIRYWLRSDHVYGLIESSAIGATNQIELTQQMALGQPVPLPPLGEQKRIVAKVEELMSLCDDLVVAESRSASRRDILRRASIKQLVRGAYDAPSPADTEFFVRNLSRFITRKEHVGGVRQMIIDLGIRGRLVPQDREEEPAAVLLERIGIKRTAMLANDFPNAAEARTQRRKQATHTLPGALPVLPIGWQWATLLQCAAIVVDCRNKTVPYTSSGITVLRTTNVRNGRIILDDHRYVSEETYDIWTSRYRPAPGDIVIAREAPMGEVAKIPEGMTVCLGQRLMLASLVEDTIDPDFLVYSLRDSLLMERVQDKPLGSLVEHLRVGGIETLLIPVPPLAEQLRIVSRINELMTACDELETSLVNSQTDRSLLLEALLRSALEEANAYTARLQ